MDGRLTVDQGDLLHTEMAYPPADGHQSKYEPTEHNRESNSQPVDHESNTQTTIRWWRSVVVSGVGLINEVNRHWARLVLGWVAASGRVNHLGM